MDFFDLKDAGAAASGLHLGILESPLRASRFHPARARLRLGEHTLGVLGDHPQVAERFGLGDLPWWRPNWRRAALAAVPDRYPIEPVPPSPGVRGPGSDRGANCRPSRCAWRSWLPAPLVRRCASSTCIKARKSEPGRSACLFAHLPGSDRLSRTRKWPRCAAGLSQCWSRVGGSCGRPRGRAVKASARDGVLARWATTMSRSWSWSVNSDRSSVDRLQQPEHALGPAMGRRPASGCGIRRPVHFGVEAMVLSTLRTTSGRLCSATQPAIPAPLGGGIR
jgi:hypothetical protein